MSEENKNQEELLQKREARRKRRQRNQILAYSVVILLIALVGIGILALIKYMPGKESKHQGTNVAKVTQTSSEESLEETEPEETESTEEPSSEPEETSSEPEESQEVVVELTYEEKLDQIVDAAIAVMPIEDKVAGLFMITPELLTKMSPVVKAGPSTQAALEKYAVGGLMYRSQNVKDRDTFKTVLENTKQYSKYPIFLAVEEEGGKATQLSKANNNTKTSSAKDVAATGDVQNAYQTGVTIGAYLKELGITMDLAPVADLANVEKSVMADRSYGSDAQVVIGYVKNMMNGLQEQGITPCIKHFPGMGSVTTDTEKGRAISGRTEEEIWASEMDLFHKLVDDKMPVVMISNMAVPALTGDNTPCTLSPKVVTEILRQQLGYKGLVMTDCLNEKAVSEYYSSEEAAILALKAGCDMILCPENFEQAYNGVLKAVQDGTISEERVNDALRRIYRIKFADRVEE
jgi:beta-N-acetylhexosaminidase